jgi:calcineurin-like phosphoesterase family protein
MNLELPLDPLGIIPTWICSDQHWFHSNIVQYAKRPLDHNERMTSAWVDKVGSEDSILCLGDICLPGGSNQFEWEINPQLPGKKFLILGNHDRGKPRMSKGEARAWYESLGFQVIRPYSLIYRKWVFSFTHAPSNQFKQYHQDKHIDRAEYAREDYQVNIHGHIHQHRIEHPRMVNISVEHTSYAPIRFEWLVDTLDHKRQVNDHSPIILS